jgi:hypothetical protein
VCAFVVELPEHCSQVHNDTKPDQERQEDHDRADVAETFWLATMLDEKVSAVTAPRPA